MNRDVFRGLLAAERTHPAHREFRIHALPVKRSARMEVLHQFDRELHAATPLAPYAHSSPPTLLQGPGECAEWFLFSAGMAADGADGVVDGWERLSAQDDGWHRVGTRIAMANLRRGLRPPQSGHDNPHYFDDLAMVRAAAIALVDEDPGHAREVALADAHATHDLDGVWCAEAVVVLITGLVAGKPVAQAVQDAADSLPADSWSHRLSSTARSLASESGGSLDLAERLNREVCDWIYSYPVAAPETLAVLLAHVGRAENAEQLLMGTAASGRNGTVLAALAGIIATVRFGNSWIPSDISADTTVDGIAVPTLAGTNATEVLQTS